MYSSCNQVYQCGEDRTHYESDHHVTEEMLADENAAQSYKKSPDGDADSIDFVIPCRVGAEGEP